MSPLDIVLLTIVSKGNFQNSHRNLAGANESMPRIPRDEDKIANARCHQVAVQVHSSSRIENRKHLVSLLMTLVTEPFLRVDYQDANRALLVLGELLPEPPRSFCRAKRRIPLAKVFGWSRKGFVAKALVRKKQSSPALDCHGGHIHISASSFADHRTSIRRPSCCLLCPG